MIDVRKDETGSDADSLDEPTPARASPSASARRRWTWFHLLCFAAAGLAWCLDEYAFHFFNNWYNGPKPPNGELHQLILSSAMFGQGLGMVLSVVLVWMLDPKKHRAAVVAIVLAASGLASSTGKMVVGRERPLESKGASVFHGPWKGPISSRQQSMPSGHTTTAAALAVVLAHYYPSLRGLMILLTAGVGINRVVTVAHYPSDVVVGAWLGTCVAAIMIGRSWLTAWSMQLALRMRALAESLAVFGVAVRLNARGWGRRVLGSPWLPTLAGLFLFWAGNGATPLWDRDEPRFATAAREMLERNDWIVPTFNGDLRPDKPILVYWLMMISYSIFGVGTFAARFFSGVAGASAVFATSLLGRSMFDRRVGLTAAWIVALSPMVVVESKICTADGVLFGFLTWGTYFLWRMANGVGGRWTSIAFWLMLALACLTKGPVAVGVIGGTALVFSLVTRDFSWIAGLGFRRGLIILAVVLGPWCWAVQDSTNGEFMAVALGKHVVERSTTSLENHRGFPGYYVVSLFLLMMPWGWALPWAVHQHGRRLLEDRRLAFLLAWLVGPLVMFEAVRTKLVHYYLPAYPAAALVLASAWVGRFAGAPLGASTIRPWLGWTTAISGVVLSSVVVVAGCIFFPQELAIPGALCIGLLGMALASSGVLLSSRMPRPAFRAMVVGVWASLAIAVVEFLPALGKSRPIYEIAQRLQARKRENIAFWNYRDPSIIFNLGGGVYPVVDPLRGKAPLLDSRALASSKPFLCPMTPELLADMSGDLALRTEIVESVSRWDGATLRDRTVHLVRVSLADPAVATRPTSTKK
jgi:4-amino-4-deoxy-L-arabinose transferase-like glycosyltransferase/membrane-associated phospholipid phosphatase